MNKIIMDRQICFLAIGFLAFLNILGTVSAISCNGVHYDVSSCSVCCSGGKCCSSLWDNCCKTSILSTTANCCDGDIYDDVTSTVSWGVGVIVGTIVGIIAFIVIISIIICCCCCRSRRQTVVYQQNAAAPGVTVVNTSQNNLASMGQPQSYPGQYPPQGQYPLPGQQQVMASYPPPGQPPAYGQPKY